MVTISSSNSRGGIQLVGMSSYGKQCLRFAGITKTYVRWEVDYNKAHIKLHSETEIVIMIGRDSFRLVVELQGKTDRQNAYLTLLLFDARCVNRGGHRMWVAPNVSSSNVKL